MSAKQAYVDLLTAFKIQGRILERTVLQKTLSYVLFVLVSYMNFHKIFSVKDLIINAMVTKSPEVERAVFMGLALLFLFATLTGFMGSRSHRDDLLANAYEEYRSDNYSFYNEGRIREIRGNPIWKMAAPVMAAICFAYVWSLHIAWSELLGPVIYQIFVAVYVASIIRDQDDQQRIMANVSTPHHNETHKSFS